MSTLRPLIGALALTALLAARTMPDLAEELVLSAADTVAHEALSSAGLAPAGQTLGAPAAACFRP